MYTASITKNEVNDKKFNLTDLGNANRFVHRHGENIRYCYKWNKWLVWDGKKWVVDDGDRIEYLAKETIRNIYREAAAVNDDKERSALVKHAKDSESKKNLQAMVALSQSEPGVPIETDALDCNMWLLNCNNGTLNLETGILQEHKREDLITKIINVDYNSQADFIEWQNFLDVIMEKNTDMTEFLKRAVGYSLTGCGREQCIFIPYGHGRNGKTTFLSVINELLGPYSANISSDSLMVKDKQGIPNDIARLKGVRFLISTETEEHKRLSESLVKSVTGGEKINARFLRQEFFEFQPEFKLWLATNHKPIIRGTDLGIWRRLKLIPFNLTIPEEAKEEGDIKDDKNILSKLKANLSGVLNWAVIGCQEWLKNGLGIPKEVVKATKEYRTEMDIIANYLEDRCVMEPGSEIEAGELYNDWKDWCEHNGEHPGTQRNLTSKLGDRKIEKRQGHSRKNYWQGIRLLHDNEAKELENERKSIIHEVKFR